MTKEEYEKQMEIAVKLVKSWPVWKQNLLEQSSKPTVMFPRQPICNPDQSIKLTREEYEKQMEIAVKLTKSWPVWKQNLLEQSSKPTVSVPRKPICDPSKIDW